MKTHSGGLWRDGTERPEALPRASTAYGSPLHLQPVALDCGRTRKETVQITSALRGLWLLEKRKRAAMWNPRRVH